MTDVTSSHSPGYHTLNRLVSSSWFLFAVSISSVGKTTKYLQPLCTPCLIAHSDFKVCHVSQSQSSQLRIWYLSSVSTLNQRKQSHLISHTYIHTVYIYISHIHTYILYVYTVYTQYICIYAYICIYTTYIHT